MRAISRYARSPSNARGTASGRSSPWESAAGSGLHVAPNTSAPAAINGSGRIMAVLVSELGRHEAAHADDAPAIARALEVEDALVEALVHRAAAPVDDAVVAITNARLHRVS